MNFDSISLVIDLFGIVIRFVIPLGEHAVGPCEHASCIHTIASTALLVCQVNV